jgi:hypothetical protein
MCACQAFFSFLFFENIVTPKLMLRDKGILKLLNIHLSFFQFVYNLEFVDLGKVNYLNLLCSIV